MRRIKSIWGRLPDHARPLCNISSRTENGVWPLCFIHIIIQQNQKKVLALVLAFACAFTMFAGAAFTDQADITVDSEVVDTLVALGVIEGYTDGSFRPDDTVTRAEMAKMIYTVRTGRSDASAYNDDATTFTDIGDHWARGYIKYCNSLGIIAGHSATRFAPDDTVTTQEAAKMLLVTLGYDADTAGLVGAGWGTKTNALADENGLLDDVNNGTTQGLPRQYAAQIIYNAINAHTVVYRDGAYTNWNANGDDQLPTIGVRYMGLDPDAEGILVGVDEDRYGTYTVTLADKNDPQEAASGYDTYTRVPSDYSALMGQYVHVLTKDNGDETYGLYADADSSVIVSGVIGDIDDDLSALANNSTVTIDGTDYDTENVTGFWFNGDVISDLDEATAIEELASFNFTAIDNNDNDKIDIVVVTPVRIEQVTYVGSTRIGVTSNMGSTTNYDLDDNTIYDGVAKDDWVVITEDANTVEDGAVIAAAEIVSGRVSSVRTSGGNTTEVRVDGTWYKSMVANDTTAAANDVDLVVYNGYYFSAEGTSTELDIAIVTGVGNWNSLTKAREVELLFADGSTEVVNASYYDADFIGNDSDKTTEDRMVRYEIDDDKYQLTTISNKTSLDNADYTTVGATNAPEYDDDLGAITVGGTTNYFINNDAVIFVQNGDGDWSMMSGETLMNRNGFVMSSARLVLDSDGDVAYAMLKTSASVSSGDTLYAYITDVMTAENADGDTVVSFNMISADGRQEDVLTDETNSRAFSAGNVVSYAMDGDTMVDVEVVSMAAAQPVWDTRGNSVRFRSGALSSILTDDDTVIIAIDSERGTIADVTAAGSGFDSIVPAGQKDADSYYANAIFDNAATATNAAKVIIVDVDQHDASVLA